MTPRLALKGLAKRYGNVEAVSDLDLELAPGEFLSLLGPSGCGKSTTLAMIAGFEEPSKGSILVDGSGVTSIPPGKRRIGLVFQDYAVFSRLSVEDNLLFGLEAQRVPRAERRRRLEEVSSALGLRDILRRRGSSLNMSEMQRVAVARTLITEPRLLLLDEPMSNLDADVRTRLRTELKLIQKELGQSVLYVTHDQVEAMSMSDRIAIMYNGRIEQVGTPLEIYHNPRTRFVAEFIGDPPINLVECVLSGSASGMRVESLLGNFGLAARGISPGEECLLGVRPHDVDVALTAREGAVEGIVRFVEQLGYEQILHIERSGKLITAALPRGGVGDGARVWLSLPPGSLHLFAADGRAIPVEAA